MGCFPGLQDGSGGGTPGSKHCVAYRRTRTVSWADRSVLFFHGRSGFQCSNQVSNPCRIISTATVPMISAETRPTMST